ncbi:hypothetical protein FIL92_01165 [SAR202 cluster bacterium AD-812-D07_MRT_10900m]|nr:hypothetical protein [SAR202 cluster bacterium AD-812-D07_MRT_10900m]
MALTILWVLAVIGLISTFFYKSTGQTGNAVWGGATFGLIVGGIYSLIRSDISGIAYGIPIGAIVGMVIQAPELINRKRGASVSEQFSPNIASPFDQDERDQLDEVRADPMIQGIGMLGSWDQVPDAAGPFGSLQNPIPVNGVDGEVIYLNRLTTTSGARFFYHRVGSLRSSATGHQTDVFELASVDGSRWAFLVLSPYHPRRSTQHPPDMILQPWPSNKDDQTLCRIPHIGTTQQVQDFPLGLPTAISGNLGGAPPKLREAMATKISSMLGPDRSKWKRPIGHVPPDATTLEDAFDAFPGSPRKRSQKIQQVSEEVRCPICGSATNLRTAKRGQRAGHQFYGCVNWPHCTGTIDKDSQG